MNELPSTVYKCTLELTYGCNFRCRHCFIDDEYRSSMFFDYFFYKKRLFEIFEELEIQRVYLFGGEPLLHKIFFEIYSDCFDFCLQVSFATNGSLITDKHISLFKQKPPILLWLTAYGYSEKSYINFTKTNSFKKIQNNINKLIENNINFGVKYCSNYITHPKEFKKKDIANIFGLTQDRMSFRHNIYPTIRGCLENQKFKLKEQDVIIRGLKNMSLKKEDFSVCKPYLEQIVISPEGYVKPCIPQDSTNINICDFSALELLNILKSVHERDYKYPKHCISCDLKRECVCPIILKRYGNNLNFICKKIYE